MFQRIALCAASALLMIAGPTQAHEVTPAQSREAAQPNDAQIAHIAYTAGQLDLEAGRLALTKSRNAAVRSFAETMIRDHGAVNDQALALVRKLGVTPEANATSVALTNQSQETARRLSSLQGGAFDRAYIENEIAFHRAVNDALAKTLIPGARNAELKALLRTGLALFQEHQKHAEALAESLR